MCVYNSKYRNTTHRPASSYSPSVDLVLKSAKLGLKFAFKNPIVSEVQSFHLCAIFTFVVRETNQ